MAWGELKTQQYHFGQVYVKIPTISMCFEEESRPLRADPNTIECRTGTVVLVVGPSKWVVVGSSLGTTPEHFNVPLAAAMLKCARFSTETRPNLAHFSIPAEGDILALPFGQLSTTTSATHL